MTAVLCNVLIECFPAKTVLIIPTVVWLEILKVVVQIHLENRVMQWNNTEKWVVSSLNVAHDFNLISGI